MAPARDTEPRLSRESGVEVEYALDVGPRAPAPVERPRTLLRGDPAGDGHTEVYRWRERARAILSS